MWPCTALHKVSTQARCCFFYASPAARFDHLAVVVWLVESEGCNAVDRAQNGVTPVHLAAAKGSINCLRWLTQHNKRYRYQKWTFVAHVCQLHTSFLLSSSVNKRADNGTTPVYFAAQEGRLDCLQFLVTQVRPLPVTVLKACHLAKYRPSSAHACQLYAFCCA